MQRSAPSRSMSQWQPPSSLPQPHPPEGGLLTLVPPLLRRQLRGPSVRAAYTAAAITRTPAKISCHINSQAPPDRALAIR